MASETCNMDENQKMDTFDDSYWSDDSEVADRNEHEGDTFPLDDSHFERWCDDEHTEGLPHTRRRVN